MKWPPLSVYAYILAFVAGHMIAIASVNHQREQEKAHATYHDDDPWKDCGVEQNRLGLFYECGNTLIWITPDLHTSYRERH